MSIASAPPLPYTTLVRPAGAVETSASARAVRASDGKWWLPMSKCCMAAVTAAAPPGFAWPRVVRPPVEAHVEEPLPLDVVDEVALPPVDDQRDARFDPELGLVRVPELL